MMTSDRLADHLFGGPQVPFWNFNITNLFAGVEVEYFIGNQTGPTFQLASKSQYMNVVNRLVAKSSYKNWNLRDQPGRISKDTESGFIIIKPDYAWHILEIAFPPRKTTESLRPLISEVLGDLDLALHSEGLQRLDISCLPQAPKAMDLVELDRISLHEKCVKQKVQGRPTIDPHFPAYIAATHVHLNASSKDSLRFLPNLYEFEPLTMKMYSRARRFEGQDYENVRTEFYSETLGHDYLLQTTPKKIPASIEDLRDAMNGSAHLFPNDRFYPVRDMSYIRPTKIGTLEFRSACSFADPEMILEIALWRKAQLIAGTSELSAKAVTVEKPNHLADDTLTSRILTALNWLRESGEPLGLLSTIEGRISS